MYHKTCWVLEAWGEWAPGTWPWSVGPPLSLCGPSSDLLCRWFCASVHSIYIPQQKVGPGHPCVWSVLEWVDPVKKPV